MEITDIEKQLKVKSKKPQKTRKISKQSFIVNLYQGKPGRDGDDMPFSPIQDIKELAERVKKAELKGYFRVRTDIKLERNEKKYEAETQWYLTQAAKKGLIDKEYNSRKKVEA